MSDALQHPISAEAVAYKLMEDLLKSKGKMILVNDGSRQDAATEQEIAATYERAAALVNLVNKSPR